MEDSHNVPHFRQSLNDQEVIQLKVSNRWLKMQVRSLVKEVRARDKIYYISRVII